METYTPKPRIKLAPTLREGREYVEVKFGDNDAIRLSLSKEKDVLFADGNAYLPRAGFDLSGFFRAARGNGVHRLFRPMGNISEREREAQPSNPVRLCRDALSDALQSAYRPGVHHLFQRVPAILCGEKPPLHPTGRNQRLHRTPD